MSGNRANSSAIQRRTNSNTSPPVSKLQTKPNFNQPPPQYSSQQQQQYAPQPQYSPQQQYAPQPNPKLSFSDAIALITIRLGRVETFINNLPPLDQLEQVSSTSQPENNENMKIVDEAVFKNIVSRLDKLEQTNVTQIQTQQAPSVNNNDIQLFKDEINTFKDEVNNNQQNIISLKEEINELKNIILQLQSYTMNTNQKLCDIIFSNENDEKNISDELTKLLSHTENEIDNGLDEYLSASLNGIIINDVDETENVSVETQNLNINI
jgi:hypothetical protein